MIGFKLQTKDKTILSAVENGLVSIFISGYKNEIKLTCIGRNEETEEIIYWDKSTLTMGDSIDIDVVDITQDDISIPKTILEPDYTELLEEYQELKNKLQINN